ncbi:MAG TPA: heavy metal translocating P-type ATPase [Dehalococcoidia bacterium]|nr:heavy metal translocating P-type ATPase [Dehalococcoidia bacterium]
MAEGRAHGVGTLRLPVKDLYCSGCAEQLGRRLKAEPHVIKVKVDFRENAVEVQFHEGMVDEKRIREVINATGRCTCEPETDGHQTTHMHHQAQMAPITMGTKQDRMQYELPASGAGKDHEHAHHEAASHEGMGHDMSDPRMARAMERDMRNRFFVALLLTVPTVLYSPLGYDFLGIDMPTLGLGHNWIALATSTPVVWWAGWIFIGGAYRSLRQRALNMSVLIATGVLAAYLASIVLTVAGEEDAFFEAAAMLVSFVLFGHWMEMKSRLGTTDALRALFDLVPPKATVLRNGEEVEIASSEIIVGEMVVIRPGDKVPVDGVIEKGETTIDESLVTGESIPVDKAPGDEVVGGSINQSGSITFRATKIGADTALGQIVRLVQQAQNSKAPGQRLADTAAQYLVILAVSAGLITFAVWSVIAEEDFLQSLTFAISAVVIACPDALGLATPTAVAVGTGLGARHNILIKDAATLESVSRLEAVVMDKTGTLTEGRPRLSGIVASGLPEAELLSIAASAEQGSEHPLARAIVEGARDRGADLIEPRGFRAIAGHGLEAQVDGRQVLIGNRKLMSDRTVAVDGLEEQASALAEQGNTPMYVAVDGRAAGLVSVADTIKPSARKAVELLREQGIEVVMMTGDNERTARNVARELGIERVFAEVLPADKARYVKQLQDEGKFVGMVGDGVNDAPALAQADVGIAIGAGTDVAIETAKVVLMKSDPLDVIRAIRLSKATVRKMIENLGWASVYNVLAIPIAAGVLYPSMGVELRPEWSALLMSVSSIIVATNAVLLKRVERDLTAI